MKMKSFLTRVLAWTLVLAAVFSAGGIPEAKAWTDPILYRESGGDGVYALGEEINVLFKYSPSFKYETTYCKLYDEEDVELASVYHKWTNTSRRYKSWNVKIDTDKIGLEEGTYHLQAYVYYFNDYTDEYRTASVCDSWFTLIPSVGPGIYLDRDEYTYTVPFSKSSVPRTTLQLNATKVGIEGRVRWRTSNPSVAKVSSSGKVTMRGLGEAVITAYLGSYTAECEITVEREDGKKYFEEHYEALFTAMEEDLADAFVSKIRMRAAFEDLYKKALEIKAENKKAAVFKKDAMVKAYTSLLVSYAKKANARAARAAVTVADPTMLKYADRIESYLDLLEVRMLELADPE